MMSNTIAKIICFTLFIQALTVVRAGDCTSIGVGPSDGSGQWGDGSGNYFDNEVCSLEVFASEGDSLLASYSLDSLIIDSGDTMVAFAGGFEVPLISQGERICAAEGNLLTVLFESDGFINAAGWQGTYDWVVASDCDVLLGEPAGSPSGNPFLTTYFAITVSAAFAVLVAGAASSNCFGCCPAGEPLDRNSGIPYKFIAVEKQHGQKFGYGQSEHGVEFGSSSCCGLNRHRYFVARDRVSSVHRGQDASRPFLILGGATVLGTLYFLVLGATETALMSAGIGILTTIIVTWYFWCNASFGIQFKGVRVPALPWYWTDGIAMRLNNGNSKEAFHKLKETLEL